MAKKKMASLVPNERIERSSLLLRGQRVILDADLAALYGVTTARLNQQVRRNIDRFPEDFAFLLSKEEFDGLKLHFATSSSGWGGRRKPPFAFPGIPGSAYLYRHVGRQYARQVDVHCLLDSLNALVFTDISKAPPTLIDGHLWSFSAAGGRSRPVIQYDRRFHSLAALLDLDGPARSSNNHVGRAVPGRDPATGN